MPRLAGAPRGLSGRVLPPLALTFVALLAELRLTPVEEAVEELMREERVLLWVGELSFFVLILKVDGVAVPAFPEAALEVSRD